MKTLTLVSLLLIVACSSEATSTDAGIDAGATIQAVGIDGSSIDAEENEVDSATETTQDSAADSAPNCPIDGAADVSKTTEETSAAIDGPCQAWEVLIGATCIRCGDLGGLCCTDDACQEGKCNRGRCS